MQNKTIYEFKYMPLMPAEISRYIRTSTGRTWIGIVTGCLYIWAPASTPKAARMAQK